MDTNADKIAGLRYQQKVAERKARRSASKTNRELYERLAADLARKADALSEPENQPCRKSRQV